MTNWYNEKFRFVIEEARTNRIVTYDLPVNNPRVMRKLSGSSIIEFEVDYRNPKVVDTETGDPILFKPWGHWCHVEYNYMGQRRIFASGIFKPSEVDPQSGILKAEFEGFSAYPNGMPWLQNWNPIAVDPFTVVNRIWTHLQTVNSGSGNLGVVPYSLSLDGTSKVIPPVSDTQLLPGFSFDGQTFVVDFFAVFIRAIDFTDCGDYINKLARDVPFDYFEESEWNQTRTGVNKFLRLAYPSGGAVQSNLAFRLNENVFQAKSRIESEIEWTSDIIIRGWFPGKVYSHEISNADPKRYRRTVLEEDAYINSAERAEAWAKRQLTRRQFPYYWESIIVNMFHPNAPFGTYDVGDLIRVQGSMPWIGDVDQMHRIVAISVDIGTNTCELTLRAEGAFNYDPIFFQGIEANLITNPSFTNNANGWSPVSGLWLRDPMFGNANAGSLFVVADGTTKTVQTEPINVQVRDRVAFSCSVYWQDAVSNPLSNSIRAKAVAYNSSGSVVAEPIFDMEQQPSGDSNDWVTLSGRYYVPNNGSVTSIRIQLEITSGIRSGYVWFDDVYVSKYQLPF